MVKPRFLYIAVSVLIADQLTKLLVSRLQASIVLVPKFLSLNIVRNFGAGFGILQGQRWLLIWISVIVIGAIVYYYDRIKKDKNLLIGSALIFAGALGNLIDRILFGYVVDFIDFSFWPAFNIADSAITIGALLLILGFMKN